MITRQTQRGSTLLVALVMLVVLTLLVISAIRSSSTNLRIAGNMQMQEEAIAAAQQATEQIISNSNFTTAPVASAINVDINQDGTNDYTANIATPSCTGSKAVQNDDPDIPSECISSGTAQNTGLFFASGAQVAGTSWCYAQQWEVQTTVQDNRTGATATLHQGVSMNVPTGTTCL